MYVLIIIFFFNNLGESSEQKFVSHFRDITWKKSKTGGFEKPYRVTNSSWVDDISKSTFNFKMNIFLIQKKNCSFFFFFKSELLCIFKWNQFS